MPDPPNTPNKKDQDKDKYPTEPEEQNPIGILFIIFTLVSIGLILMYLLTFGSKY